MDLFLSLSWNSSLKIQIKTNFFHYLSIELIYSNKKKWGDLLENLKEDMS